MNKLTKIRELFTPTQPAVNNSEGNVAYHEISPDIKLENHIYCYWRLESKQALSKPFFYRVVADGCIDIITSCDNPFNSSIMGFSTTFKVFPMRNSFKYVGIRFLQ